MFASTNLENIQEPKKDNMLQSIYKSVTSHLTAGISNPLSVTLVSPDLYKSLHQPFGMDQSQQLHYPWGSPQNSYTSDEPLRCATTVLYNTEHNFSDSDKLINLGDSSDSEKRWREYKNLYVDCSHIKEKGEFNKKSQSKEDSLESQFTIINSSCNQGIIITALIMCTFGTLYIEYFIFYILR